jgi:peptide deformylase
VALLPVLQIPNPLLKARAHLVSTDTAGLQSFIDDMLDTMVHHSRCVGLAATQVGRPWRLIVVDASRVDKEGSRHGCVILLNPFVVRHQGQKLLREGCLSVPDFTGNVLRADAVEVHGKDRAGKPVEIKAHGFEAIVFQHELDHLDGKLFLDRVASLETDVFRRKKYS